MTVVMALQLGEKDGQLWMADERQTGFGGRTYDVSKKIYQLTPKETEGACYSIGSAGLVSHSMEIRDLSIERMEKIEEIKSPKDIVNIVKESYKEVRNKKFEDSILGKYNATWEEYKRGQLDPSIKDDLKKVVDDRRGFDVDIITGGRVKDLFSLYYIVYPGSEYVMRNYMVVGSGTDRADIVLGDGIQSLSYEKRQHIPLDLGARILLEATRAAWRNVGVGGSGQIVHIDKEDFYEFEKSEINLLHNLIYSEKRKNLDKSTVTGFIKDIINRDKTAEEILKELGRKIDNKTMLNEFFLESVHQL